MKNIISTVVVIWVIFFGSWQNGQFLQNPDSALACDYCILTRGFTPLEILPGPGLRVDARYTVLNSLFAGTDQIKNHNGEKETHFTTQITMFYNFSNKFTIVGILPVPRRSVSLNSQATHPHEETAGEEDHHGPVHTHTASGSAFHLGDLNILAKYTFLRLNSFKQSTNFTFEAGIKLPTGKTTARASTGDFLDAHIQPGTGSWNYLVGFSLNHANDYFGLSTNVLYSINTTGKVGDDHYRYGNWLNAAITAKYEMFSSAMRNRNLFLTLGINGEFRGNEELNGQNIENTGGKVLYLVPGFQFMISPAFSIEAALQYPFYHNLDGDGQLGESLKTFFGINYLL